MPKQMTTATADSKTRLRIQYKPLSSLKPFAGNARTHPEEQIEQLRNAIRAVGFTNPILIAEDGEIIAGHGRYLAAQREKLDEVPTILIRNADAKTRRRIRLADNRIALNSGWDEDLLRAEIEAAQTDGDDPLDLGFDDGELDSLFDEPEPITIKEIEVGDVFDTFWVSVRGPLKHQAEALRRLRAAMEDLGDVEVDLGTFEIDG